MGRLSLFARASLSLVAATLVVAACSSDGATGTQAAIASFCQSFVNSPAFTCCTAADRATGVFLARYRFSNPDECIQTLSLQLAQATATQVFDSAAAGSCLQYLSSRPCGIAATSTVKAAEETAGCARVLAGTQDVGGSCLVQEDCKAGLFCPSSKDTGSAFCSQPATSNQDCYGQQAGSIDHPACAPGLFCSFVGENSAGCPSPPCLEYQCVPPFDEGDPCSGLECGQGLSCTDGTCETGGPNGEGGFCRVPEHCQPGLYCDLASGTCAQRKQDGEQCTVASNGLFECKGICTGAGEIGTCTSFCGQ